jgi:hypothetical protein
MSERRADLTGVDKAVSEVLDEILARMHGILTSQSDHRPFLDWLKDRGYQVLPNFEQIDSDEPGTVGFIAQSWEWAVFCGHPDDGEDTVDTFEDPAEAEELAQRVIDAHIGRRLTTWSVTAWEVLPRCGACGSVRDDEVCCDGRAAEIEAGEAAVRDVAALAGSGSPHPNTEETT